MSTATVAPPVKIDAGDLANQIITSLEPIAATAINAGVTLAAGEIPGGTLILDFLGKGMVSQFVATGAKALEGLLAGQSLTITPTNALEGMVLNSITAELPAVASFFSTKLPAWISAEVAKIPGFAKPA